MKKIVDFFKLIIYYFKMLFCKKETYKMFYSTYDEKVCNITYAYPHPFGDNRLLSNTYENGGVLVFEKPLTCISAHTFSESTNLKTITIPDTVEEIESCTFNNNTMYAFYGKFASNDTKSLIINNKLIAVALSVTSTYTVPNNVTNIENVFTNIKRKDLTVKTDKICGRPLDFEYSYIQLVSNIPSIPDNSFKNNVFSRIELGEDVKYIGKHAFMRSHAKYDYDIPSYHEFNNDCQIICHANKPPQLGDEYTFGSIYPGTDDDWPNTNFAYKNIYVPDNSIELYKKEWAKYNRYIQKISIL